MRLDGAFKGEIKRLEDVWKQCAPKLMGDDWIGSIIHAEWRSEGQEEEKKIKHEGIMVVSTY